MKSQTEVNLKLRELEDTQKIILDPASQKVLVALLTFLANFIYKWFMTPDGEKKSFWKALLVAFNGAFWTDLFGLKAYLDQLLGKL